MRTTLEPWSKAELKTAVMFYYKYVQQLYQAQLKDMST